MSTPGRPHERRPTPFTGVGCTLALTLTVALAASPVATHAAAQTGASNAAGSWPTPLAALPSLALSPYLGRWHQVALYPNRFQKQCVSDTTAQYALQDDGALQVINRCRNAAGGWDEALGLARPDGRVDAGQLTPAQLKVSFLPTWLRWLPVGWGSYWVIALGPDQRYAVVSEPTREYLWVLSRTPQLLPDDDQQIRGLLTRLGFDLARLQPHRQANP